MNATIESEESVYPGLRIDAAYDPADDKQQALELVRQRERERETGR